MSADASRTRLAAAATQAFSERGFHGTTTRDIATAAGMSPAAVYVHHRSKEDLLYEISLEGHRAVLDVVRSAARPSDAPERRLADVVRAFAADHARNHVVARVVNYELGALSAEHHADILELRVAIATELRALIDDGVRTGAFDTPSPSMAATAILSLGIDIARWYRDGGRWTADDIGDFYADLAMRMVGSRLDARRSL